MAYPIPQPKWHLNRFSCFCINVRILYNGTPFSPLKIAPSHGGSGPPSNTWFSGPTRVLNPNGISIGAAVFAGLTSVTDRLTDLTTQSVTIGRNCVHSTAVWPNKNKCKKLPCIFFVGIHMIMMTAYLGISLVLFIIKIVHKVHKKAAHNYTVDK